MKFVLSHKNRSIYAFLNFIYFFVAIFLSVLVAFWLSIEIPLISENFKDNINSSKFFVFTLMGMIIFYLPIFLKKYFLFYIPFWVNVLVMICAILPSFFQNWWNNFWWNNFFDANFVFGISIFNILFLWYCIYFIKNIMNKIFSK